MDRFPGEIKTLIFLFDSTKKEMFDKTLHQMKFVLPMFQLKTIQTCPGDLKSIYFKLARKHAGIWKELYKVQPDVYKALLSLMWACFMKDHLKPIE